MERFIIKKAACVVMAILFALVSLCACGSNPDPTDTELPKLVIGVDYYEPYVYRNDDGEYAGIDVELAIEACRIIGYEPVFKHVVWEEKNALLAAGEIDCVWCCFSETGRENEYAWTLPYMNSRQVVAVKADSDITRLSDLADKRIAVQSTTKADEIFSGRAGIKDLVVPKPKQLNCFPSIEYLFAAINEGFVDAIAGHELVLKEYMKASSVNLRIIDESLLDVTIGVAFSPGTHADVIEDLDNAFRLMKNNGYLASLVSDYGLDPDVYLVSYEENR